MAQRAVAHETATAIAGTVNGSNFAWIADADSRLGPVFEVLLNGAYYWVPFERICRVTMDPPTDARDFVWIPAQFTWVNEGTAFGFIPTRYPGSEDSDDVAVRLARKTVWEPLGADGYRGLGQRVLVTDTEEYGLLDIRELVLAPADRAET
jgi:type VI secretion system protein ImpE